MVGYRMVKIFEDMDNRLHIILACDGQTDRQTSCHGIVRAIRTSHSKNCGLNWVHKTVNSI